MGCVEFTEQYLAGRTTLGIDYPNPIDDWRADLLQYVYRAVVVNRGRGGNTIHLLALLQFTYNAVTVLRGRAGNQIYQIEKMKSTYNAVTFTRGRAGNQIYQESKLKFTYNTPVMIQSYTLAALAELGSLR